MKLTIYRGTHEIGGTLIECQTSETRLLIDAGYPLFLNGLPISSQVALLPPENLLELGVLPHITGLYSWDDPSFDAIIVSHAHIDHYGLLRYVHPDIPVYISEGTQRLINLSQTFKIYDTYVLNPRIFRMYEPFYIGELLIKPYLMDHSAFDAAAFEIFAEGKTIIYSGDFRGHGRKAICLDRFIEKAQKQADILLTEGTMFGRLEEKVQLESALEDLILNECKTTDGPLLFQSSSQNIDRIVTFYRVALRLRKTFVVDVYTANVLYELHQLSNKLPYPSQEYSNIKVFYPYRLTKKIFDEIGEVYAKRFSSFHMPKEKLSQDQNNIVMIVRPSMLKDIEKCQLQNGVFIYSMWQGYRQSDYQQRFENYLKHAGFRLQALHTSGHATVIDIKRLAAGLDPKKIIPIHTKNPKLFEGLSDKVEVKEDGVEFDV